ncbi:LytR/AlgR family response regulator transcription factor [Shewanella woodyi]|uniref:LytR/AlgR family response regulator transcription factor n=1 Tax=Shewanella woodyi TaxID=60961 RepID=UPI0007EA69A8|nr:LytTR family DNA-binding domain-containing protein [Shewanella woodyi]
MNKLTLIFKPSLGNKLLGFFLLVLIAIVTLAIFQDYLHSKRGGYPFFFSESLLFKTLWFLFPPILLLIKSVFQQRRITTPFQMGLVVCVATLAHLLLVPLTIWCLSTVFREQSYGFVKVLSFTLSNDLVKIVLVYGVYLFLLNYLGAKNKKTQLKKHKIPSQYLSVSNGKNNTRIKLSDISYIKAATPYIAIQVENKQHLHSETLKSIGDKLDPRFVRVHKSSIVNIEHVLSYKSRLNGDYDLLLEDGAEIRLSRNYVNDFKKCFEPTPQLTQ